MSEGNSFMLDSEKGEATARFGEDYRRMVIMASESFVKMMEALNTFGSAGLTMFYMMGREKGRYDVLKEIEALRRQEVSFTKRHVLENIVRQLRVTGWGAPRIQKYDEKQEALTILVENNPVAIPFKAREDSDKPVCHYFRGYWVGVVSIALERKVSCVETKCMSMGAPYCEFEITVVK